MLPLDASWASVAISAGMSKRRVSRKVGRRAPGNLCRRGGKTLTSYGVGALPILNRILERTKLKQFLKRFLVDDQRCRIAPSVGTLVLVKNYLVSREPIYGVSEWARQCVPALLDLSASQVAALNDDRVGRWLDRLFEADRPSLVLAVTRNVVEEFGFDLSELHNDSTTVAFFGAYEGAATAQYRLGKPTPAITWGYNKDHRPDLKQLLYNLTVTCDGAVPVAFGIENRNVTDDQTHRATWDLLCQLVGGPNFIYVADSKLATNANMTYIVHRGGRFISVLPRTRAEDKIFRAKVMAETTEWEPIETQVDEFGMVVDVTSTSKEVATSSEGFRLLWFHSTRKAELDRQSRTNAIRRAFRDLDLLRLKLRSPRTRFREEAQVVKAVAKCLADSGATDWVTVEICPEEREILRQEQPGRPGPNTRYRKESATRFTIRFDVNNPRIEQTERQDGVFPLVTNDRALSVREILAAYKRQAQIEKRFSQLKTQFQIAPVFLKSVHRVVALLTVYYLALLVQALLERELRLAMSKAGLQSLQLYPEERECSAPTTRRIIDLFENVQLHELDSAGTARRTSFTTELSSLQRDLLHLLGVPVSDYGA